MLTEACTNVAKHAYRDGENGEIVVRYIVAEGDLAIEVEDSGTGFGQATCLLMPDRNGGGHGIKNMIICVLSDELYDLEHQCGNRARVR